MFEANNLPDMEFPNDVPSSEFFNLIDKPAETTSQAHATQSQATSDIPPPPNQKVVKRKKSKNPFYIMNLLYNLNKRSYIPPLKRTKWETWHHPVTKKDY
ncbi:hypothetical protein Hamer_G024364 [Homarus americanus]|uniref:Uncharacterized protein n=1 Tax=Homarus americanus TaxID=6706 RepID=A0A8J5JCY5_HOMAM|nr:hypothetical protein Hamer_G024364 [Homarus americanus]